jgi:hypothetical protein
VLRRSDSAPSVSRGLGDHERVLVMSHKRKENSKSHANRHR